MEVAMYFLKIEGTVTNGKGVVIPAMPCWSVRLPYPCDLGAVDAETQRMAKKANLDSGWSLIFLRKM